MQSGDDPNALSKKTFLITMIGVALYAGAVFVFILR
jgi:hypothetical protein